MSPSLSIYLSLYLFLCFCISLSIYLSLSKYHIYLPLSLSRSHTTLTHIHAHNDILCLRKQYLRLLHESRHAHPPPAKIKECFFFFFNPVIMAYDTECPKIYRKSVLHLLKYIFAVYLSRCSTDLR